MATLAQRLRKAKSRLAKKEAKEKKRKKIQDMKRELENTLKKLRK